MSGVDHFRSKCLEIVLKAVVDNSEKCMHSLVVSGWRVSRINVSLFASCFFTATVVQKSGKRVEKSNIL